MVQVALLVFLALSACTTVDNLKPGVSRGITVALPAYPATDVALRSLEAFRAQEPYRPSLAVLKNRHRHAGAW